MWIFPNVKNNHVEKTAHPCQFPVELVERLVLSLTDPGDAVFDPYMGVGSAVVAALKHERDGFGCDTIKEYVDIAWERVYDLREGTAGIGQMVYMGVMAAGIIISMIFAVLHNTNSQPAPPVYVSGSPQPVAPTTTVTITNPSRNAP